MDEPRRLHGYRARAYRAARDLTWRPQPFEEVYLPPWSPFKCSQAGMVLSVFFDSLGDGWAKVRYKVHGFTKQQLVNVGHLRATGRTFRRNGKLNRRKRK